MREIERVRDREWKRFNFEFDENEQEDVIKIKKFFFKMHFKI